MQRETRYYVDQDGKFIGAFEAPVDEDGNFLASKVPSDAAQVPNPPSHAQKFIWDFQAEEWVDNLDYEEPPYSINKNTMWRRCTDEEAETIDAAIKDAPVKQRRLWDDAKELDSDDDLFAYLHSQMADAFGTERADELLAREE